MACGLPVVVTSAGAVAELVAPGTGIVVAPNSVDCLCDGVARLFRQDRAAMGALARQLVCAHYDWNRVLPQLLARYHALLGQGSACGGA